MFHIPPIIYVKTVRLVQRWYIRWRFLQRTQVVSVIAEFCLRWICLLQNLWKGYCRATFKVSFFTKAVHRKNIILVFRPGFSSSEIDFNNSSWPTGPLEGLLPGDFFWAGDFPVQVTSSTGGDGIFSGLTRTHTEKQTFTHYCFSGGIGFSLYFSFISTGFKHRLINNIIYEIKMYFLKDTLFIHQLWGVYETFYKNHTI